MQYESDTAQQANDPGVGVLAVRNDTLASIVDSDGDWAPLQVNASGALYVDIDDTEDLTVSSDAEHSEDAAHSSGDTGFQSLAVRNDTLASLVDTDGDYAPFQVDANGAVYEHLADISSVTGQASKSGSLPVTLASDEDTVPVEQQTAVQLENTSNTTIDPATADPEHAEDAAHSSGDAGVGVLAVRNDTLASLVDTDGDYAPLQVNANGAAYVEVSTMPDVTQSAADNLNANANLQVGDTDVSASNAVPETRDTDSVIGGDAEVAVKSAHIDVSSSGENTVVAAVTNSKIRVLSASVSTDSQENVGFLDGSGGSLLQKFYLGANTTAAETSAQGFLFETSSGNALIANLSGANNTSIRVTYVEV